MRKDKNKEVYIAVFSTHIDFAQQDEQFAYGLNRMPEHKKMSHREITYQDVVATSKRIIDKELKEEFQKYTDVPIIDVEAKAVYDGSIEIVFTVVMDILALIGGLKDIYDVTAMIQKISEKHIKRGLQEEFQETFDIDVRRIVPGHDYLERYGHCDLSVVKEQRKADRDAFFYYLLVANILLMVIVGILVFGAVKAVYFG